MKISTLIIASHSLPRWRRKLVKYVEFINNRIEWFAHSASY